MSLIHTQKTLVISSDGTNPSASPQLLFDGTNAIAATRWSVPLWVKQYDRLTLQVSTPVASTLVAAITMEGSDDAGKMESLGQLTPGDSNMNWSTLSFVDEATSGALVITKSLASGAQSFIFTVPSFGVRWWRMKETFTSGTGNLIATVQMKGTSGK